MQYIFIASGTGVILLIILIATAVGVKKWWVIKQIIKGIAKKLKQKHPNIFLLARRDQERHHHLTWAQWSQRDL